MEELMREWISVHDVLDFAIGEEEGAVAFYTALATRAESPGLRKTFLEFVQEEMGHKDLLMAIKSGESFDPSDPHVQDLKIGDYLVDVSPSPDMSFQDALILAMKKERAAFRLYSDLADVASDERVRNVFLSLAQEEAKHKLRFELEYDEQLSEN
jgi:rubrerythrin